MKYFISKIAQALITLILISMIVFVAVRMSGNPVKTLVPTNATEAQIEEYKAKLGLDQPLPQQYLIFVRDALKGDFGVSYSAKRSVMDMIGEKLPYTLELAVTAIVLGMVFTVIFGSLAAIKRNTIVDTVISGICAFLQAAPTFFLAILLIQLFGVKLKLLPIAGADTPLHLILPGTLLGAAVSAGMVMLLRNNMIEVMDSDFIKFSRLKGISEYKVILKHALRNSFSSVLAMSSFIFAHLIAGSIAIEAIFAWPGLGTLSYNAVISRDFPVVQGIVLILSALTILLSLIIDVVIGIIDPRIRTGR